MKSKKRRWERWTAQLAPLAVPSVDGRLIGARAEIGRPACPQYAYLAHWTEDGDRLRLGMVKEVVKRDGWLTASGELFVPNSPEARLLDQMAAGELAPQMELTHFRAGEETRQGRSLLVVHGGILAAVMAGKSPAWPECRFILEEA